MKNQVCLFNSSRDTLPCVHVVAFSFAPRPPAVAYSHARNGLLGFPFRLLYLSLPSNMGSMDKNSPFSY